LDPHWPAHCEQIRATLARYTHAGDQGRLAVLAACFCEDGVLAIEGEPRIEGRPAIEERLLSVVEQTRAGDTPRRMRHHVSSIRIEAIAARGRPDEPARPEAAVRSYFLVLTELGPDHWGSYRDRFRREADDWLIAERKVRVDGASPQSRVVRASR